MKKILLYILVFVVFSAPASGCGKKASKEDKLLAKVSNKSVTLGEFKARISKLPSYYQDVVNKNKKRYLDEMIMEMLLYEDAVRKGLDKDKEVREVISEARKKILIAKLIKNDVEDKVRITEEEIGSFYNENKDKYKTPELWRASHILVATEAEAKDMLDQLSKGASFEDLARAHSTDMTATRGGDLGYFKQGQLVPEFENACFKLNIGQFGDIVHTQFGYHVIKLTDRKVPAVEDLSKVRRAIESELRKKRRSDLFDKLVMDLKGRYGVQIKEDVYKNLDDTEKEISPKGKK